MGAFAMNGTTNGLLIVKSLAAITEIHIMGRERRCIRRAFSEGSNTR